MTNFKNPETKEEFYIHKFRTSYMTKKVYYTDAKGKRLKDKDGTVLVFIDRDIEVPAPGIRTQTKNRI